MAGGKLEFDPLKEVRDMVDSNCNDLHYRQDAVNLSLAAGLQNQPEPARLPPNIYGTEGDWETYSTPSRDARLKTAFKELREQTERFVTMYQKGDAKLVYKGHDLVGDLIAIYDHEAGICKLAYGRTDGSQIMLGYVSTMTKAPVPDVVRSPSVRGATLGCDPQIREELATACHDGASKQIFGMARSRTCATRSTAPYEAEMDFTTDELKTPGPGKGCGAATGYRCARLSDFAAVRGARPHGDGSAQLTSTKGAAGRHGGL